MRKSHVVIIVIHVVLVVWWWWLWLLNGEWCYESFPLALNDVSERNRRRRNRRTIRNDRKSNATEWW